VTVHGYAAPGFERVRDEFERNLRSRHELGAACAAYHRGEKVVDLWGGFRDATRQRPWEEDTLVLVYSTSKGLAAMTIALLHSRGLIDYDERVATYWPEFAQNGKERITVRQLLGHEAGLCAIDERLSSRNLGDFDEVDRILAAQAPAWSPGTRHGYHALSIGWYEAALVRRIDPDGRSLGRFFAEEIAAPLELEFYFGLPSDMRRDRIAKIAAPDRMTLARDARNVPPRMALGFLDRRSLTYKTFANPRMRSAAHLDTHRYRALEIPAGGGIGSVRSIARAYSDLATGGHGIGISEETLDELKAPARMPSGGAEDLVLRVPTMFSLGYAKPSEIAPFGSGPSAFGHPGAGGSFAFADPEAEVSFAYAMNRMGLYLFDDPREKALRDALYASLDEVASTPAPSSMR
jgi:CubicO group peptidase (beta-lactamase class C family)